jgi:NAD(P)H dehydrogenase (quinone)
MKHAVILAHPSRNSFNAAVARAYAEAVKAFGDEVVFRDLYHLNFDPRLQALEMPWIKGYAPGDDVVIERSLLKDVKVFVFVYPLWFNAPPAMLKGYVDRVFGYGFGYEASGGGSAPLLSGRCLASFTTSGAPDSWVEETGAVKSLRHAFDDHVGAMCGPAVLEHKHFGGITPRLTEDAARANLRAVRDTAVRLFAPVTSA